MDCSTDMEQLPRKLELFQTYFLNFGTKCIISKTLTGRVAANETLSGEELHINYIFLYFFRREDPHDAMVLHPKHAGNPSTTLESLPAGRYGEIYLFFTYPTLHSVSPCASFNREHQREYCVSHNALLPVCRWSCDLLVKKHLK